MTHQEKQEVNLKKALEAMGIYTSGQLDQAIKNIGDLNIGCMVSTIPQKVESKVLFK
ncbi:MULTISPECIES: hypothetical protein [Oceanobacillus]|uniref:hypothetical protein n=1 Tax=Oceanobacillus TaxID=182709 RepID=UPI000A46EC2F|nr:MULTISPECIES: hypothetical protein [Oceanobacillus]